MPIRIKISKRAITKAVVETLERNQESREAQKLTQIVGDQTVRQGQNGGNILGNITIRGE